MVTKKEVLEQLRAGRDPQEMFSKDGLFDELKKAPLERIPNAELDEHPATGRADGPVIFKGSRFGGVGPRLMATVA